MNIIKTYEDYNKIQIQYLDLGRFSDRIEKSKLIPNDYNTYDYTGNLDFSNLNFKSLSEIPIKIINVYGSFNCSNNQLISLKGGASLRIGNNFDCSNNQLISLQYSPLDVGQTYYCGDNFLLSEEHKSNVSGGFNFNPNPFKITAGVIETIKRMSIEQRVLELKFFKDNDSDAYKMMLKAMNENDIGYGEETKRMSDYTDGYTNAKEMF